MKAIKDLRIYYASHDSGISLAGLQTWRNNLFLPLCDIAGEVIRFPYDLENIARHQDFTILQNQSVIAEEKARISELLLEDIRREHSRKPIDIFFSYFSSAHCDRQVIEEIKKLGILTINWFCNASYQFYLVEEIAGAFDYCLVPEKYRLDDYRLAGANPIYCQEAANPNFYRQLNLQKDTDISFIGSRYGNRYSYLRDLYNSGLSPRIWGHKWHSEKKIKTKSQGQVFDRLLYPIYLRLRGLRPLPEELLEGICEDMEHTINRSRINLGFSVCGDTFAEERTVKQVRLRDFEIPMCGGFYLAEEYEELAEFFEPGKEIVFFSDSAECTSKARFYLQNERLRNNIAAAGYRRAQAEHTWQKRLTGVLKYMGFR